MDDLLLWRSEPYRANVHDLLLNFVGDSQFTLDESRPNFRCWLEQRFARDVHEGQLGPHCSKHVLPDIDQCRLVLRDQLGEVHLQYIFERLQEQRNGEDVKDPRRQQRTGFFFMYSSDQIRCAALMIKLLFGCTPDVGLSSRDRKSVV